MAGIGRYLRQHHLALLALFVALGGTAYAAASISSNDIVDNSIKARDIRDGTISSRDVGKNSLSGADIDESTLEGPGGPTGASAFQVIERQGSRVTLTQRAPFEVASAECAAGETLVGGGWKIDHQSPGLFQLYDANDIGVSNAARGGGIGEGSLEGEGIDDNWAVRAKNWSKHQTSFVAVAECLR